MYRTKRHAVRVIKTLHPAFTLLELLVVISIIVLLMAMLVPALGLAKEHARRNICRNHIHQLIPSLYIYGEDHRSFLPSGLSDSGPDEHTPVMSTEMYSKVVAILTDARFMQCPWLKKPFTGSGWKYDGYGYVLGYNYLGGHQGTPWTPLSYPLFEQWYSPQQTSERSDMPIITELNAWTTGEHRTFAPHGRSGPILSYMQEGTGGQTAVEVGAVGGNTGFLDGSVCWKKIGQMRVYQGSRMHWDSGCQTMW